MLLFSNPDQHKRLFALALPMILSNITVPLIGLVDTAVVGHLEHAYYLGGSTIGAMLISVVVWLCGFLRMSTTGLSAQAFGQDNTRSNIMVLLRGICVAFTVGVVLVLCQSVYIDVGLALAGGSEQVQFYAKQYAQIRIWGAPAALANLVILGWLIGNQKSKAVMWLLITANLVNVGLDLLFVFGLNWQVKGVAFASLIAEYSTMLLGLFYILSRYNTTVIQLCQDKKNTLVTLVERSALLSYFRLNRDILIRTLCLQVAFLFITFQGAKLGDNVVAANAILMNFLLLISFGLDGIANAAEAMVGKAYGEKNTKKLQQTVHIALFWNLVFAGIYSVLFLVAGEYLLTLITSIDSVIAFAKDYLVWIILLPIISCWCYLYDGIYIGLLQAKVMRNSMIVATFACFFPLWFVLQAYENHALWAAFLGFMLARGITLAWHFHTIVLKERG
ncbi:MATE family efflux transporter [Colwellia sp. D2M02]|uniref:MATE family efflux transporter n=1 Tax=Colwellia sp. D2M02 TaxID=2841562 RepID=UPI00209187F5|nr:MATE family efflux transporter [Colwellia sp. D2M02]